MKYQIGSDGRISIEKKEDMIKRNLASPDEADSQMIAFAPVSSNVKASYKGKNPLAVNRNSKGGLY